MVGVLTRSAARGIARRNGGAVGSGLGGRELRCGGESMGVGLRELRRLSLSCVKAKVASRMGEPVRGVGTRLAGREAGREVG